MQKPRAFLTLLLFMLACRSATTYDSHRMSAISQLYVHLVLALGEHDADYVDAYYGPPAWRVEVKAQKVSLAQIRADAVAVIDALQAMSRRGLLSGDRG